MHGSHGGHGNHGSCCTPAAACGPVSCAPHPVMRALFTSEFTQHDYCEFLQIEPGCLLPVPVRFDPGTNQRAAFVTFSPMSGDFAVSLSGAVDFSSGRAGNNAPLLNPASIDLYAEAELMVYSLSGAVVKACWYRCKPKGERVDRLPLADGGVAGFAPAACDVVI